VEFCIFLHLGNCTSLRRCLSLGKGHNMCAGVFEENEHLS
jgi:hypothetical protein